MIRAPVEAERSINIVAVDQLKDEYYSTGGVV